MSVQLPTVILSPYFSSYPKTIIGNYPWRVGQWLKLKTPLPEMILLPTETIHKILNFNRYQPSRKLTGLVIPKNIKLKLVHTYNHFLDEDFVKLEFVDSTKKSLNFVKGDANLLQTIGQLITEKANLEPKVPSLLITRQPQADVSGIVYTQHPLAYSKAHYFIEATAGVWLDQPERSQLDTYQIDIRTQNIVKRQKRTKNLSYRYQPDGVIPAKPIVKLNQYLLSEVAIKTLAQLVRSLALHEFKPLKVYFTIKDRRVFITQIKLLDLLNLPKQTRAAKKAFTPSSSSIKTYLKVNSASSLSKAPPFLDGVIYSHKQAFLNLGIYPLANQKSKRLFKLLAARQWQRLNSHLKTHPKNQLFLKLLDLTPTDLAGLKQAPEAKNLNSSFNLRGALRLLHQPNLLELELATINLNLDQSLKLNLVLPFVRNFSEVAALINQVYKLIPPAKLNLYVEVVSPQLIFTLDQLPLRKLAGVVVNLSYLQATTVGFDLTDNYLLHLYRGHTYSVLKLLNQLDHVLANQPKPLTVILDLPQYRYEWVSLATKKNWHLQVGVYELERTRLAVVETLDQKHGSH